ncbi:hypothetical protein [Mesorhizobium sp. ORM16]|uniref:hypothetical protein n=1 Tax=Mesorhizobium sp. ORM16 TaxID=3376989 RepID=UPI0038579E78
MSRDSINIIFEWDGEAMRPLSRFHNLANAEFVVGERYRCEVQEDRSWVSHKHQFAWLHEAWLSLPEHIAARFLNEDQMHKHGLIAGGFCDSTTVPCASRAEAERWYKHLRSREPDTVISINGNVLIQFTAWSQSRRAMDAKTFQKSKQAVLDYVDDLLGVQREQAA